LNNSIQLSTRAVPTERKYQKKGIRQSEGKQHMRASSASASSPMFLNMRVNYLNSTYKIFVEKPESP
jgi:hypothetical protein